jgi:hypothetical protein
MKRKHKIWPFRTGKCSVRTGLSLNNPANAKECGNTRRARVLDPGSCGGKRDSDEVGASFAVLNTARYDSTSKRLNLLGLGRRLP